MRTRLVWHAMLGAAALISAASGTARGELFYFKNGRFLDGVIVSQDDHEFRIRLMGGVIDVPKTDVVRREPKAAPWDRLADERVNHPDTAQGHYDLAQWCKAEGFVADMKSELRRAIELDPDFAPARKDLGYIRDANGRWAIPENLRIRHIPEAEQTRKEEAAAIRKEIGKWVTRVRQIRSNKLEGGKRDESSKMFQAGRRQLLALNDPLAIPAIAGVLSAGTEPTRRLMIEALSRYHEDDATLNLIMISIFDPSPDIRRRAAEVLASRRDNRMVAEYRSALRSSEDQVVRNAARALGVIGAEEAVPDLIPLLDVAGYATVVITRQEYCVSALNDYCGPSITCFGGVPLVYYPPSISVFGAGSVIGSTWYTEIDKMAIYRTEVQEALIAITGKNFGFDMGAWSRWWEQRRREKTTAQADGPPTARQ